jgi:AcrR family transcriptional regulator
LPAKSATKTRARLARKAGTHGMPRADREQLILEVAGRAFARDGYHSASMDEIAALADVSKPMVYAYFGSKEELYLAYIERTGRELLDRLVAAGSPADEPLRRLRARITEFFAFVELYRDGWTVLFAEMTSNRPVADQVAELRGRIAAAVRRMLEEQLGARANLSPITIEGTAHAIVGAGESLANWWLERPEVSREEVAQLYVGLVRASVTAALSCAAAGPPAAGPSAS